MATAVKAAARATTGKEAVSLEREQVLAFRLAGHHLDARLPEGALIQAAGACGIRNAPPWAAPISFLARVEGFRQEQLEEVVEAEKTLIQVWSLRVSPLFVPVADLPVFTTALLPVDERAARLRAPKLEPLLTRAGVSYLEAHERINAAASELLGTGGVGKGDLQDRVEERVGLEIWPYCERCQVNHIADSQLHPTSHAMVTCFGPREGNKPTFVRIDRWLGKAPPSMPVDEARQELARRYLRCYGPSDAPAFAEWAGVSVPDARHAWGLLKEELVEVAVEGSKEWLLAEDVKRVQGMAAPAGVRLLPPFDPYLLLRDKETIAPEKGLRARVWRPSGTPGTVLVAGVAAGTWTQAVKGKRLVLTVDLEAPPAPAIRKALEAEAARLAALRGCETHEIVGA